MTLNHSRRFTETRQNLTDKNFRTRKGSIFICGKLNEKRKRLKKQKQETQRRNRNSYKHVKKQK